MEVMNKDFKTKEELEMIRSKLEKLSYFTQFVEEFLKGSKKEYMLQVHFSLLSIVAIFAFEDGIF